MKFVIEECRCYVNHFLLLTLTCLELLEWLTCPSGSPLIVVLRNIQLLRLWTGIGKRGRPHFAVQIPEDSAVTDPTIDPQGSGTQDDRASASAESAGPLNQIGLLQQFFHCHLDSHIYLKEFIQFRRLWFRHGVWRKLQSNFRITINDMAYCKELFSASNFEATKQSYTS